MDSSQSQVTENTRTTDKNYRQRRTTDGRGEGGGNMAKIWQHARGVKRGVKKRKIDIIRPASPRPSFNTPRGFN